MAFKFSLDLYGAFFYVLETDGNNGGAVSRVWVLGIDARSGCVASDKETYIASHLPALQLNPANIKDKNVFVEENLITLDDKRVLWLFDGDGLSFDFPSDPNQLCGQFLQRPVKPDPCNRDYFSWIADLPSVVPGSLLKPEIFEPDPPGICCRVVLEFGSFTSTDLCQVQGQDLNLSFEQLGVTNHHKRYGALANGISVALGTFDYVTLHRAPIAGRADKTRQKKHVITLTDDGSGEVKITLFNSPADELVSQMPMAFGKPYVAHFEHFYGLLQNPPAQLLVPYDPNLSGAGPTTHNISCPPAAAAI